MLKLVGVVGAHGLITQPPSGGCVLKPPFRVFDKIIKNQPPSGGCVLKLFWWSFTNEQNKPAAFRRLCVETNHQPPKRLEAPQPPLGGCVLKHKRKHHHHDYLNPAAFRRLCVETKQTSPHIDKYQSAAFRRLCVETAGGGISDLPFNQPPSGGCVLKRLLE